MDRGQKNFYVFLLSYMVVIAGGSLTPIPIKAEAFSGWDKVIHVALYTPLGFLLSLPKVFSGGLLGFTISLSFGTIYGALMEALQNFVAGRSPSLYDAIANALGVGIGLSIGQARKWMREREKKKEISGLL